MTKESVVLGHHLYKEVWRLIIGQQLPVFSEPDNIHDRRAIVVYKDSSVVGHVPRELSVVLMVFLKHDGKVECAIRGRQKRGKGLEVPCMYRLKGSKALVGKGRELL